MLTILGSTINGMLGFWGGLFGFLFIFVCLMLIGVVLLQKGKGGGLSSAFGGGAGSAFGTKTGDVMTWVTIVIVGLFLLLSIGTAVAYRPEVVPVQDPTITLGGAVASENDTYNNITIASPDSRATLYYTTDGKDPYFKSKDDVYGTKIKGSKTLEEKLKQGTTIKVIAVNKQCRPAVSKVVEKYLPFFGEVEKKAETPEKKVSKDLKDTKNAGEAKKEAATDKNKESEPVKADEKKSQPTKTDKAAA